MIIFEEWRNSGKSISELLQVGEDVSSDIIEFFRSVGSAYYNSWQLNGCELLQIYGGFDTASEESGPFKTIYPTFAQDEKGWFFIGHCADGDTKIMDWKRMHHYHYSGRGIQTSVDFDVHQIQTRLNHLAKDFIKYLCQYVNTGFQTRGVTERYSVGNWHKRLVTLGVLTEREEQLVLSISVRHKIIEAYNLSRIWAITGKDYDPNGPQGEITLVMQEEQL